MYRRLAPLSFVLALSACGGGAGDNQGGPGDPLPPVEDPWTWPGIPPPVPQPSPQPVVETASGRFGVVNGNLPPILSVEVLTAQGGLVDEWTEPILAGETWEVPAGDDLAPGLYVVRVYCSGGSAARWFQRGPGADAPVMTRADWEYGF